MGEKKRIRSRNFTVFCFLFCQRVVREFLGPSVSHWRPHLLRLNTGGAFTELFSVTELWRVTRRSDTRDSFYRVYRVVVVVVVVVAVGRVRFSFTFDFWRRTPKKKALEFTRNKKKTSTRTRTPTKKKHVGMMWGWKKNDAGWVETKKNSVIETR